MVLKRTKYNCVCERVIDGDTIIVAWECPTCSTFAKLRVRLARIDAPEFSERDKVPAERARAALAELVEGKSIEVIPKVAWPDKYGRLLAEVLFEGVNVSNLMVARGAAVWWP